MLSHQNESDSKDCQDVDFVWIYRYSTIFFPLASDAKMPAMQRRVNTVKMALTLIMKPGMLDSSISASPINKCIDMAAMAMLNIIPVRRMVPSVADAVPRNFFSTELITEWVLGEENRPKPTPSKARVPIRYYLEVSFVRKISKIDPTDMIPIPREARILESMRSDIRPEMDATIAISTGWVTRIIPASTGINPFTFCRYRLSTKVMAKVAA